MRKSADARLQAIGNIPDDGDAQQRFHIRVMRMRFQRISEEDQDADLAFSDLGSDLLIPLPMTCSEAESPGDRVPYGRAVSTEERRTFIPHVSDVHSTGLVSLRLPTRAN